ncbi:carbohydrate kinase [bacterium]|nr:carbohydrate kinase [bacterium]
MTAYILTYDVGTTGIKTCLFELNEKIKLIQSATYGYKLYTYEDGGAEQNPEEWWEAMCKTTKKIFAESDITPQQISGISFCSQMQSVVLVDKDGNAVRNSMSYMDQRSKEEIKRGIAHGIQIANANIFKLVKSLYITGAVSASVKDPVWKYKWIEAHEKDNFDKAYKWLDVKEYLIARATGEFVMTEDSAWATLICNIRGEKIKWSNSMIKMFGINKEHLANIVKSTDKVGVISGKAAKQLGLQEGTAVFGGGGDASLIGVGAGATNVGDTHIYSGTSGWVGTVTDKSVVDVNTMIAAIVGAQSGKYLFFAEMETSGKCLEWVKNHLALDEIDIYLDKHDVTENMESQYTSLYDYMMDTIKDIAPGSKGVIFTPWLHGNRCPFEDPLAKGVFFNISLETGKRHLIRAVLEGICYHKRWMLESQENKVKTSDPIRFVGGGAISPITCQILADILGRTIETVQNPQNVGAVGAAAVVGVGLGIIPSLDKVKDFVPVDRSYTPNLANKAVYDKNFEVFKSLYKSNKQNFKLLNK